MSYNLSSIEFLYTYDIQNLRRLEKSLELLDENNDFYWYNLLISFYDNFSLLNYSNESINIITMLKSDNLYYVRYILSKYVLSDYEQQQKYNYLINMIIYRKLTPSDIFDIINNDDIDDFLTIKKIPLTRNTRVIYSTDEQHKLIYTIDKFISYYITCHISMKLIYFLTKDLQLNESNYKNDFLIRYEHSRNILNKFFDYEIFKNNTISTVLFKFSLLFNLDRSDNLTIIFKNLNYDKQIDEYNLLQYNDPKCMFSNTEIKNYMDDEKRLLDIYIYLNTVFFDKLYSITIKQCPYGKKSSLIRARKFLNNLINNLKINIDIITFDSCCK